MSLFILVASVCQLFSSLGLRIIFFYIFRFSVKMASINFDSLKLAKISMMNQSLVMRSLPEEEALPHMQDLKQGDEFTMHAKDVRKAWSRYLQLVVEHAG